MGDTFLLGTAIVVEPQNGPGLRSGLSWRPYSGNFFPWPGPRTNLFDGYMTQAARRTMEGMRRSRDLAIRRILRLGLAGLRARGFGSAAASNAA